eukprot:12511816-Alexandrium_andersonii.AAC.1
MRDYFDARGSQPDPGASSGNSANPLPASYFEATRPANAYTEEELKDNTGKADFPNKFNVSIHSYGKSRRNGEP